MEKNYGNGKSDPRPDPTRPGLIRGWTRYVSISDPMANVTQWLT